MAAVQYQCKIIGDGKSTETAFRPAIADITVPVAGTKAFPEWSIGDIPVDEKGIPIQLTCVVQVSDDRNSALVIGNPDITKVVAVVS